jgi:ferrochelatase
MIDFASNTKTRQSPKPTSSSTQARTGVLLVNLGTPDSPSVPDVRKYLREFLMDARVIDIPFLSRFFLVNMIIAPFRAPKSAKIYQELWTEKGSPLKIYGFEVAGLLQQSLGSEYLVVLGMRYQNPSIESALAQLKDKGLENIIVVPLFPQYASATTGSVHEKVMEIVSSWQIIPQINFVNNFLEHPKFIQAFALLGKNIFPNTRLTTLYSPIMVCRKGRFIKVMLPIRA